MADDARIGRVLPVIAAIIFPPLAVGLKVGIGMQFILSIILTVVFFVPGVIHALWVVLK